MTSEEKKATFDRIASEVRGKAVARIRKFEKLIRNLRSDLEKHGDPNKWKRFGDLLLSNPNAPRRGDAFEVTDHFSEDAPLVRVEADPMHSLTEAAENYFRQYAKARNGEAIIAERMASTEKELGEARLDLERIDRAISENDQEFLNQRISPPPKPIAVTRKKKVDTEFKGARRFISSDGFEILVGKKAADNDFLTFRVARSLDTWMHAADYPGSHVIVRNAGKKLIPDRTLLEAAQLAAFYSDARDKPKAAVNHTLKKFVNKPRRSAPGLVSLSAFKTLLVEPKVPAGINRQ